MTLRSSDLQSDSDLDSIRNSCDVLVFEHFPVFQGGCLGILMALQANLPPSASPDIIKWKEILLKINIVYTTARAKAFRNWQQIENSQIE